MKKTIALLTGGGDCPGLNAVIRAVVRTAIHEYKWQVLGFYDGYRGLVENDYAELTADTVDDLLDKGGTMLGTSNVHDPFNFLVDGQKRDLSQQALQNLHDLNVQALFLIGGDGTMRSGEQFRQLGLNIIGIPKTIDNDLVGTDFTFGFQTAVKTATEAIDMLHTTAESHHRLMVMEVMGRYAGWIALYTGIAGGAHVILLPEIPYDYDLMTQFLIERRNKGKNFSIIVAAEGARAIGGHMVVQKIRDNSPDPIRLGGVGALLANELEQRTGIDARSMVLGHLQRGGRPIPFDRVLSTRFGAAAVEAAADEEYGVMVALQGTSIVRVPLQEASQGLKLVPADHELIKIGHNLGVCFGN
ncbi:MAG: ATP-dependent 6-phosphofructokinase [Firmicutes bacterium]|nr:ATP-dependent 6-phosphofructokinase [Bacillota bacterium]